jgi:hypothetical protein
LRSSLARSGIIRNGAILMIRSTSPNLAEELINKSRFAVIDLSNDADIANPV